MGEQDRGIDQLAQQLDRLDPGDPPEDVDALRTVLAAGEAGAGPVGEDDLAALASALRTVPAPRPRPTFEAELRSRLVAEAASVAEGGPAAAPARPAPVAVPLIERFRRPLETLRRSAAVATASALGAMMIGGVGVVAAAERSAPDSALYGLKQITESVRLAVAEDEAAGAGLHLQFAERRLAEVADGTDRLPGERLVEILEQMDGHTTTGTTQLLDTHVRTGETWPLRDVVSFVERQRTGLRAVTGDLPVVVSPAAATSLELLDRIGDQVALTAMLGCVPCAEGSVSGAEHCCAEDVIADRRRWGDVPAGLEADRVQRMLDDPGRGPVDGSEGAVPEAGGTSADRHVQEPRSDPAGDTVREVGERTTGGAGGTTDRLGGTETTRRTAEDLTETTRRTTDEVTEEASETTRRTTDRVAETADELTGLLD